jgi:4-amino-4-deoxy-L-arabinose transferase-like glycosyltransferase
MIHAVDSCRVAACAGARLGVSKAAMNSAPRFALLLAILGLAGWLLCGLWADFPYFYHTDEPGKVRQLAENTRNFNHPLLMLESAALAARATATPAGPQPLVELGRSLSAAFCALAAVLLAWTVSRRSGIATGLLAGALLLVQPDVQEYARYFKEDPALLFGCAACFAAMAWFAEAPSATRAALLGAAVALAASAKYVGAIMLVPALWVCLAQAFRPTDASGTAPPPTRWSQPAWFALGLILVLAAVNARLLLDWDAFRASLQRETTLVLEGQAGITKSIPHGGFFERLLKRSSHLLPLCLAGLWAAWQGRRARGGGPLMLLALSPALLALLLAFSTKDSGRYFLPASLGIAATAALGTGWLAQRARESRRLALFAALAVVALGASAARAWPYLDGFRHDARRELFAWINENLPAGSRIAQGPKVCLPDHNGRFADGWHLALPPGVTVKSAKLLPDLAPDPAALAAAGFTHAALASDEFQRYLRDDQRPKAGREAEYLARRRFYLALDSQAQRIWHRPAGKVGTHQPELRLYRLPVPINPTTLPTK